jgi:hypothetical protein
MSSVEQSVEWELAGITEILGENLPQCHYIANPKWPLLGSNTSRCGGNPATNSLSYDMSSISLHFGTSQMRVIYKLAHTDFLISHKLAGRRA